MPACSSDVCASGRRFRCSSPPNSRSNSASPPPSWPAAAPGSSPLSVSPSNSPPIGTFRRSTSNLSSSSLSQAKTIVSENRKHASGGALGSQHENPLSTSSFESFESFESFRYRQLDRETNEERSSKSASVGEDWRKRRIFRSKERDEKSAPVKKMFLPARIFGWYVNLAFRAFKRAYETLSYVAWAPVIWISAWICVFWVTIQLPLNLIKWFIRVLYTPSSERSRNKRCVLITGGSTIQALHLARNFYKAGARVVVCEIEGLFGLARFSTACARFYNVPRPGPATAAEYVNALKSIVEREKVVYFIPVSCTSSAYYDSLAKSHLEIMGCECFVPGAADVSSLEDPLQLMRRCSILGLARPEHRLVKSLEALLGLYESGNLARNARYLMISAGPTGMTDRAKLHLPCSVDNTVPRNLHRKLESYEISERRAWLIVREPASSASGYQLVTCTTVKDSRVVANVTCRLDEARGLVPEERNDVNQWLDAFFRAPFAKRINGHLSFKLAFDPEETSQGLVPISCRVGVPLPYLCLTSVHPRLVWRPCRHFSRQNSLNFVLNEKYKKAPSPPNQRSASSDGLFAQTPSAGTGTIYSTDHHRFAVASAPVLDKRDALFVYWDPLPYCAYYHLQFPFRRLAGAIRERPAQHKPPLGVVQ
ncbi:uncharacterized protein [Venturia canescens]|uniref:uncharacterized protein n=1 Tax=Venturia canescens TaxID=32260 RepID=UPI001C9C64D3|nr:uncharacterized protein LOC122409315 [Venturia canescens]